MVRGGVLAEPVREVTIASTLQRMLQAVLHIGADVEWLPGVAAGQTWPLTGWPSAARRDDVAGGVRATPAQEAAAADPGRWWSLISAVEPDPDDESEDFEPDESELAPLFSEVVEALVSDFSDLSDFSALSDLSDFLVEVRLSVL